jgi:hypothetical protein
MIKRMTLTTAAMTLGFMAGTAGANLVETFDGAGYTAGNDVTTPPYMLSGPEQQFPTVAAFGFDGTQGATKAGTSAWGAAARPTGVTGAAQGFTYSWMFHEDATESGTTRLSGGIYTTHPIGANSYGAPRFGYEADGNGNQLAMFFTDGPAVPTLTYDSDTWYEVLVTGTPAAGGWDVSVEHRIDAVGAYTTDLATTLWAKPGFVPAWAGLEMIGLDGNSAQDNIMVLDIPEPGVLALLGLGVVTMLVRRQRRMI